MTLMKNMSGHRMHLVLAHSFYVHLMQVVKILCNYTTKLLRLSSLLSQTLSVLGKDIANTLLYLPGTFKIYVTQTAQCLIKIQKYDGVAKDITNTLL